MPRRQHETPPPRLIDARGRVSLPREIMERLGVGLGDHVSFVVEGDRVEVVAVEWKLQR